MVEVRNNSYYRVSASWFGSSELIHEHFMHWFSLNLFSSNTDSTINELDVIMNLFVEEYIQE